ncbi:serine/threonine protein kinase [Gordonia sp. PDNC005]|uniref:serine/threonine-protein kinase n=1 Tax=unclassified Gordonia (in: high G+C Gram-positive bacteria) TaxID=2657482 RepID=UPI001965DCD5|nr:serine/threonine-protein kinase [Gordonia sp. PDNC005]QRY61600.1 serine/threonine protein kinase [Gordonia sp. PDNC005]
MTSTTELAPDDLFAGHRIVRIVGRGGMGEVYQAQHPRLPRVVALKVLSPEHVDNREFRRRFEREADLAARLDHPAIVGVHDRGEDRGRLWISLRYVEGDDALRRVREFGPLRPNAVAQIVQIVASALDYAHSEGVIHRDVKPANILLGSGEGTVTSVHLTDLGIARPIDDATRITTVDSLVGSVDYTAPERLLDGPLVPATDQYALGCTAYHLLTGRPPYNFDDLPDVVSGHLSHPVPSVAMHNRELAPVVDQVLRKVMSKNPVDRYPDCRAFAADLAAALTFTRGLRQADSSRQGVVAARLHRLNSADVLRKTRIDPELATAAGVNGSPEPVLSPPPPGQPLPTRGVVMVGCAALCFLLLVLAVAVA